MKIQDRERCVNWRTIQYLRGRIAIKSEGGPYYSGRHFSPLKITSLNSKILKELLTNN